jgi:hypothetical protein
MRRALMMLVVASGFLAAPALAQTSPKAKFYEFPTLTIDGTIKQPTAQYHSARDRVKFDRLAKLKKSMLGELQSSGSDISLR